MTPRELLPDERAQLLRRPSHFARIWWRGETLPEPGPRVAIVGSRAATAGQLQVAREIAEQLTKLGAVIVSGGALGVDTAALTGACAAKGQPIAVLPSGLDVPHPPVNAALFQRILDQGGGLCGGVMPGQKALRGRFLPRNRLLTSIADALIVVSAAKPSGSLHCAHAAWKVQLPVFATPWSPGVPCSEGSNGLIAAGARAICPDQIDAVWLRELAMQPELFLQRQVALPLLGHGAGRPVDAAPAAWPCYAAASPTVEPRQAVPADLSAALSVAAAEGLTVEEMAAASGLDRGRLAADLLLLALSGTIRRLPGGRYAP